MATIKQAIKIGAMSDTQRGALPGRLLKFVRDTHPPVTYLLLTGLWSFSVMGMLQRNAGRVQLNLPMLQVSVSFFLVLLFLRAIDEIKDLDYDRLHNADRPLVSGEVTIREVCLLALLVASSVMALNWRVSPGLALFLAAEISYGLCLLGLEHRSRYFRESILVNLAVTFPVSAALNVYAYLYLSYQNHLPPMLIALPVLAAHMAGFLHFEFGRKLKWPHFSQPGENGYAMVLGAAGAIAVCAGWGVLACALSTWIHVRQGAGCLAWLPWFSLTPSAVGVMRFWRNPSVERPMKPYFAGFLVLFFLANIVAAIGG